MNSIILHVVKE